MKSVYDIIRKPIITEKSMMGAHLNREYHFEVARDTNKVEIKKAMEEIFGVKVESVNTVNYDGKKKRMGVHQGTTSKYKKAIVKLSADSKGLEIFDGMM